MTSAVFHSAWCLLGLRPIGVLMTTVALMEETLAALQSMNRRLHSMENHQESMEDKLEENNNAELNLRNSLVYARYVEVKRKLNGILLSLSWLNLLVKNSKLFTLDNIRCFLSWQLIIHFSKCDTKTNLPTCCIQ